MARYIDADKLIEEYDRVHIGAPGRARKLMVEAPTADVVPKSEVERWRRQLEAVLDEIPETKREVAREIFEEIENLFTKDNFRLIGNRSAFAELKKKYTEGKK